MNEDALRQLVRQLVRELVALLERKHRVDQHNPYSLRELHPALFSRVDEAMKEFK